jgi:hypothetical protein
MSQETLNLQIKEQDKADKQMKKDLAKAMQASKKSHSNEIRERKKQADRHQDELWELNFAPPKKKGLLRRLSKGPNLDDPQQRYMFDLAVERRVRWATLKQPLLSADFLRVRGLTTVHSTRLRLVFVLFLFLADTSQMSSSCACMKPFR